MFILVAIVLFLILFVWACGFLYANDLSVPTIQLPKEVKKVLVIFPHADDEALTSAGTLSRFANNDAEITWVIYTKGEKGNEGATYDEKLKDIRVKEAQDAGKIYGVSDLIQREYPDNGMDEQGSEVKKDIIEVIEKVKPDLVITYDLAGLYGHPDHIIVSQGVTDSIRERFPTTKLWYASYPQRLLDAVPLPEHMAKDADFKNKRSFPNRKVWIGVSGVIKKIKAVYIYKSQRSSYVKNLPVKQIPLWFYISLTPFEYFHEVSR